MREETDNVEVVMEEHTVGQLVAEENKLVEVAAEHMPAREGAVRNIGDWPTEETRNRAGLSGFP
jgi:hypothetical protein